MNTESSGGNNEMATAEVTAGIQNGQMSNQSIIS